MPRSGNPYYSGPESDHFDGQRFFNPDHPDTDRSLRDLLRWKLKGEANISSKDQHGVPFRDAETFE